MSVEPITITLETDSTSSTFPLALKKVLEIPPPNLLEGDDGKLGSIANGFWRFSQLWEHYALALLCPEK